MLFEAIYIATNLLDIELNLTDIYSAPTIINKCTWYSTMVQVYLILNWIWTLICTLKLPTRHQNSLILNWISPRPIINKLTWYLVEFKLVFVLWSFLQCIKFTWSWIEFKLSFALWSYLQWTKFTWYGIEFKLALALWTYLLNWI